MTGADAGIFPGLTDVADHRRLAGRFIEQCHVDHRHIAPQAKQNQAACCELVDGPTPAFVTHLSTGPRPMLFDHVAVCYGVENPHS